MKNKAFSIIILFLFIFMLTSVNYLEINGLERYSKSPEYASEIENFYKTTFVKPYKSKSKFFLEPNLENLQCPIPLEDRVKNYTGTQCVYSSIEMLGRWAEEPKLTNPPLTQRPECQSYSSPLQAAKVLNKLNVKFEQTYGNKTKGLELIKKAMREGRGALWSVPGHAMVLIHYDEFQNKVCWIDNSDRKLRVQETTIDKFSERWTSWVLIIYADNDIITYKNNKNYLPIMENNEIKDFPINFIPFPINY